MKKFLCAFLILLFIFVISACGKKQTYKVTFDSLGGTAVKSQSVESGKLAEKPKDPIKEGFTFVDWQQDNKTFDFSTPIKNDVLLTAFYTINDGTVVISVAFNADNSEPVKTVSIAKGCSITEPPIPQKQGYKFIGWYIEDSEFDFSTILNENTVLVAKWEVDNSTSSDKKTSSSNKQNNTNTLNNASKSTSTLPKNHVINFADVEGVWYAEGHDDATLKFSISNNTWVFIESKGFDYTTCTLGVDLGRGGTDFFYDNGKFNSEAITLESSQKLIYSKNNKTVIFYRQKNYPTEVLWEYEKLLKDIDGFYWYLDGYDYTYVHPTIGPWFDHKCLSWESENINITSNKLVAFENYDPEAYNKEYSSASSNTHNTLLVNPIESADILITNYKMSVKNNKLYMTIGGKEYSFTRYNSKKTVKISLETDKSEVVAVVGDSFTIDVKTSPWWKSCSVTSSASGAVSGSENLFSSNGKMTFNFHAVTAGNGTITLKESNSGVSKTINVTIKPLGVTSVSLNKGIVELYKNDTETLVATVSPSNASNKNVTWTSSNTSIASVSSNGKITANGFGNAIITVTTNDGHFSASCNVSVKQRTLTVKGSIGMETQVTSTSIVRGVSVNATASGGSESYTYYSIKLYYNNQLIGETENKHLFVTPLRNGTYTAEIHVKDSNGNEATTTTTTSISY